MKNKTHLVVHNIKENTVPMTLEGYVSKGKEIELKTIEGSDGKNHQVINAIVNVMNQDAVFEYLCKLLDCSMDCIYSNKHEEDTYYSIKVVGFNNIAVRMERFFKPSNRVVIVGNMSVVSWKDSNENEHKELQLLIQDFWVSNFYKTNE